MTNADSIIKKTQEYLGTPSVVGYEKPFLNKLKLDFEQLGFVTEEHNGLLAIMGANPESNYISAHIDRHGLIANGEGQLEYAAYIVKEEHTHNDVEPSQKMWDKIASRFQNEQVYAYSPETGKPLASGKISSAYFSSNTKNFVFELDELRHLEKGTPVSFSPFCDNEWSSFEGQLDNVINAAVGFVLCKNGFDGTLLLTCGEEVGMSWRYLLQFFEQKQASTDRLYVLDTSPFKGASDMDLKSVILRNRDNNAVFNHVLLDEIKTICMESEIPFLVKDEYLVKTKNAKNLGNTELGHLIAKSGAKITGTTVQIPTVGYHSNRESAKYEAIENVYIVLSKLFL